jgi:uncharacterized caspase-like protein
MRHCVGAHMRRFPVCRFLVRRLLAITAVTAIVTSAALAAPERVALVIGNSKYVAANALPNAANDARTMVRSLRALGFEVAEGLDTDRAGMERLIREFLRNAASARVALLYYAGHGLQVDGRNYLIPVDAKLESASDLGFETIELDNILENLNGPARANIIVLDACRNNPFTRSLAARMGATRALTVQSGLAGYSSVGTGTLIAFSTAPGTVALDGSGGNSPFTLSLAKHIGTPGIEVRQMLTRVRADVAAATGGRQIPWDNSSLLGDVYLGGPGKADQANAATVAPAAPAPSTDEILWGAIKDSSASAVFEEFVRKFPSSPHAVEARGRAAALRKDAPKSQDVAMLPPGAGAQIGKQEPVNGPLAAFSRHNGGWSVAFSFVEPVAAISWRLGETGNFRETGFLDTLDPRTRRRVPNPSIQLDADQGAATIFVRYVDLNGASQGPFPVNFNPVEALARDQRKILEMTAGSWLSFRDFNGVLLYYTHLVSYRCGIRQVRIGLNSAVPDRALTLPPCNLRDPMAIPGDAQPYLKVAPTTASVSVEITYQDGSVSEVKTFRR